MFLNPQDLGCREAWQCVVPGDLEQALSPDSLPYHLALRAGSLIVPQDGWTNDLATLVQHDQPVHLPRQTDGSDLSGIHGP